jgi:Fic family protein
MLQWIRFFLVAVTETSKQGIATFKSILTLRDDIESRRLITLGKKLPRAKKLLNHLYKTPKLTAADVGSMLDVTPATANVFIKDFVTLGILREMTGGKRNRVFTFHEYLSLFTDAGR